ncbi:MAG: N-formylglutamate amidohydrolase [Stappiaceae bacterium]
MLEKLLHNSSAPSTDDPFQPVELIEGDWSRGLVLLCDHASNGLPSKYGSLGLPAEELARHIGYDIGTADLTRMLARALGIPAVMTTFSRLLIDPNRGEDDPTLVMRLSDGAVIPGNAYIDKEEIDYRLQHFYRPYHQAVTTALATATTAGPGPAVVSIHSFTANWRGWPRPWHAGVLWDKDPRLAVPLIEALGKDPDLIVGDNEPYLGALKNDTMYRHASSAGLAHALLEIRQDLIGDPAGVAAWCEKLVPILLDLLELPDVHQIRHFGSSVE